jgi:hypothetical protein
MSRRANKANNPKTKTPKPEELTLDKRIAKQEIATEQARTTYHLHMGALQMLKQMKSEEKK